MSRIKKKTKSDSEVPISRVALQNQVHKRVENSVIISLRDFIRSRGINLWGEQKPQNYLIDSIYILLYHDLYDVGYLRILERIQKWYPNEKNSLVHNCQEIRLALKAYANHSIKFGTLEEWIDAAQDTEPDKDPKNVNIWADSTDFQIEGRKNYGSKSDKWSPKLKAPGRRYMFFRNGLGIVIKLFGGFSPKIRDYMWIEERADWLNEYFLGATLIGDGDWRTGMKYIDQNKVTIHAPYSEPRGKRAHDADLATLTKAQQKYNQAVQNKRQRIENQFSGLESKFEILKEAWAASEDQLDALVWYGSAIMNEMKLNKPSKRK
jgi:hypothetical protein